MDLFYNQTVTGQDCGKMRVCDRHPRKKATDSILLKSTDSQFDLCAECIAEITKFISNVKQENVEGRGWLGRKKSA